MDPRFFAPTQHSEPARSAKTESERPCFTGQEPFVSAPARTATEGGERPGSTWATLIESAVDDVLAHNARGLAHAMTGDVLAAHVRSVLIANGIETNLAPQTLRRRCQEAVAALVESGVKIGSCSAGYYIPETLDDIEAGERPLIAHLASTAKRLRVYRRGTADEILRLLGQLGLSAEERAA